ncbi:MAG: Crp/Fnr family transcriptional regulator [Bacteroidetes bacterium]|nr:Crp/Fnr family transcriptional regulator [Bacteroidota bacterium]
MITPDKKVLLPKHDISVLVAVLNYFHPLPEGIVSFLQQHTVPMRFGKKKMLVKAGAMCEYIYFIQSGAVRGFSKEDGKELTTWITLEHEMVSSITSLDIHEPCIENIQAIEDCVILAISFENLEKLYQKFPEFNIVGRKLLQKYYRDAEVRAYIARLTKAENKYRYFLKVHPGMANRIPLKYIASYLAITQETLSRVRKNL